MFKKIICLFAFFSLFLSLSSQTSSIRLGVLKGISCVPCAYLIENKEKLAVQNMAFQIFDSAQKELPSLLKGEIDAGFLSPEDAAKVFSAGNGSLVCLGVVQNGNAFLLTCDENFGAIEDLKGKTLFCSSNDSSSKILENLLSKKEIALGEGESFLHFDFSVPPANLANKLILGEAEYALLSEPYASVALLASKKIRRVESVQKIYNDSEEFSTYPAMLLVAKADFAKENHNILKRFCDAYKNAVGWTNKNSAKAGLLSEKHGLALSFSIVRASIPNAALTFREANSAKPDIERYLMILERESPGEEFYFLP